MNEKFWLFVNLEWIQLMLPIFRDFSKVFWQNKEEVSFLLARPVQKGQR